MKICNKILQIGLLSAALGSLFGCSVAGRLQRQQMTASLSQLTRAERQERQQDYRPQVVKLQRDSNTFFLAPVDTLADGERVMALQIEQVTVVAKMRSIPERNGRVVLDFIVTLPRQLLGKSRSVVITPILHKPDESAADASRCCKSATTGSTKPMSNASAPIPWGARRPSTAS